MNFIASAYLIVVLGLFSETPSLPPCGIVYTRDPYLAGKPAPRHLVTPCLRRHR